MSILRLNSSCEMFLGKNWIFFLIHTEAIATVLRLTASRESICASVALFATVSRLIRYCLTREKRMFLVFM